MLDPSTIASLVLATVLLFLGVVAWLAGRPAVKESLTTANSPRRATGALPPPGAHMISPSSYTRIANQLATDIATEAAGIRPWRNIVTPAGP